MGEVKGYTVPEPTTVSVKDKVEYAEIPDISLLIKTEADIVAQEDDLEIKNATEDTDNSEITGLQNLNGNGVLGVDVSKYNGDIDWNKVRDAGISFAVIRAGYRGATSGSLVVDPKFEQNMQGALDAGLDVGVYFFTQAVNEVEAVEEASAVLELCKDYRLKYPVFIDSEGAGGNGRADALDTQERTKVCEAFCKTIENAGQTAGVYASKNWYQGRLDAQTLESHTIWLAEYRGVPKYEGYYQLWQYTSKGQVDGITGNVDLNVSYLTQ
jgi:GH25 family lysozyme M1 (1,4-beta-N-acetylmuramidase)